MNCSPYRPFPIAAMLLILAGSMIWAQVESSSLTGTVSDQQGKRIPHAKVRATQVATGLHRETETTAHGDYGLVDLPAGIYSIQISKDGFSIFQAERIEQIVGQTRTLNATLDVAGGVQQASITEPLVQLDRQWNRNRSASFRSMAAAGQP
jgi:hypothetical protein